MGKKQHQDGLNRTEDRIFGEGSSARRIEQERAERNAAYEKQMEAIRKANRS
jgi:hypothetical protein